MAFNFRTVGTVALLAAALAGGTAARFANAGDLKTRPHEYLRNASGQTYGSALDAPSPDNEPDLIDAIGVDGTRGYVRKADLNGPSFATPDKALGHQKARPPGPRRIPLLAVDGRTVIGAFIVDEGVPGK